MTNKGLGMTFISMQHIEKRFGDQEVLKDVSLEMKRGEIVSIIGPSGSGKSTFLRCLGQLETIDGGTITVDEDVLASTDAQGIVTYADKSKAHDILLRMGMVFQSFNLFPHMTYRRAFAHKGRPLGETIWVSISIVWWAKTTCSHCSCIGDGSRNFTL